LAPCRLPRFSDFDSYRGSADDRRCSCQARPRRRGYPVAGLSGASIVAPAHGRCWHFASFCWSAANWPQSGAKRTRCQLRSIRRRQLRHALSAHPTIFPSRKNIVGSKINCTIAANHAPSANRRRTNEAAPPRPLPCRDSYRLRDTVAIGRSRGAGRPRIAEYYSRPLLVFLPWAPYYEARAKAHEEYERAEDFFGRNRSDFAEIATSCPPYACSIACHCSSVNAIVGTSSACAIGIVGRRFGMMTTAVHRPDVMRRRGAPLGRPLFSALSLGRALSLFGGVADEGATPNTASRKLCRRRLNIWRHPNLVSDHFTRLGIGGVADQSQEAECERILRLNSQPRRLKRHSKPR
jgi:hypothetical protein